MSKQLLVDFIPFDITPQMLSEVRAAVPNGPFTLKGPLQKAGEKNHNGRVYPKNVLEREVEKYQQIIKERRALGELDHPDCHRESAEILTKDGWKLIKDSVVGEEVATLNMETDTIEFNPVERVIGQLYTGKMISMKGKNLDVLTTPNHRFVVKDRGGNLLVKTAQEIFEISKKTRNPHLSIPKIANNWDGRGCEMFSINGVAEESATAIHLDFGFIKIEEVDYDGTVHCVTVKNGTFYCRDQNKAFWSGNSSVINLKNVCHNVVECHWEGDTVMGTIEILTTPSGNIARDLIKNNIRIGISSRGLGSTRQVSENTVEVQDDFELLCFDLVSSPSTRGAYMAMNEGVIKEGKGSATTIITDRRAIDKYMKIEGLVRDILSEIR